MSFRRTCAACDSNKLEIFLDLGNTPLADKFPVSTAHTETWYPLQLAVCRQCWLVQLTYVVDDDVLFGGDYGFYAGAVPSKVAYHKRLADELLSEFPNQRFIVEIGSNDGDLLRHISNGIVTLGVDPAEGPAHYAINRGVDTLTRPFTRELAELILDLHGPATLIVANHVAAHVTDLHDFFEGISVLLDDKGIVSLEVQYLPHLLVGNQFDNVYHEHRYHFTLRSLDYVLRRHGLSVLGARYAMTQGGSIRVTAGRDTTWQTAARHASSEVEEDFNLVTDMCTYTGFAARVEWVRTQLRDLVARQAANHHRVVGYGATAKSTTLLNFCELGGWIECVEDLTPHKIGRFTPGTKLPIIKPDPTYRPDTYLLLAWNYLSDVLRRERVFIDAGGRFIVPVPVPVLL